MAQSIILKRSSLAGKVPDTGSLNLGEVAVNTYDGKLYFKKSGSVESIESIVTTNSTTTGSIRVSDTGSFGSLKVNDTLTVNHGTTIISGSQLITNDLIVLGAVNAQQFNISIISSSVIFQSGSTKFGDTSDDTHEFTGSVDITGSLYLNGIDLSAGNNSGSFSGSFQGLFAGDGSQLRGVVTDDLPIDGWDYDSNSSASISEFNNESKKYIIDFQWEQEVGTPIGFKTFISNVTGSSQIVPTSEGIKFIVGNQLVATVDENGINATLPAGVVSSSAQLTSSYDTRYVLSGSVQPLPSGVVSGSSQITISDTDGYSTFSSSISTATANSVSTLSASIATRDINQDTNITNISTSVASRLDTIETTYVTSASIASATATSITSLSSSISAEQYAKLNVANIFTGQQTITGSMYVSGDLIVQGSSSLQNITASAVSIGTNVVYLNNDTPAVRFGGISVFDSGSTNGTGSLFWDSQNERWLYQKASGSSYSGGMLISGPRNLGALGDEVGTLNNVITKGQGGDHITSSQITDDGTTVSIPGTLSASVLTGIGNVTEYSSSINNRVLTIEGKYATTGSNTFTGNITINTGTTGFLTLGASNSYGSISSGGNGATIYLNGATRGGTTTAASNTIVVATDGEFYITNGAANSTKFLVASNGNTTISGIFTENSSIRYKENVETIKYGLDKVLQMRGVTYDKKDNGVKEMGVIAEEVYDVLPEVVLKNEEGEIDSVSYSRITAVLIEAIKDLKKEIEDLKSNR